MRSLAVAAIATLLALPVAAQLSAELSVGGARYQGVVPVEVLGPSASLRYQGRAWWELATGVGVDSSHSRWAAGSGGARWTRGSRLEHGLFAEFDLSGFRAEVLGLDTSGWSATTRVGPFARLAMNRTVSHLDLAGGVVLFGGEWSGERESRAILQASARASVPLGSVAALRTETRWVHSRGESYPFLGAELVRELGFGAVWATFGGWFHPEIERPEWGIGASIAAASRVSLQASVRQHTNEPVYANAPRVSWTLGLDYRLGSTRPRTAEPAQSPLSIISGQRSTVIRVPKSEGQGLVSIAGSFNGWSPEPLASAGEFWEIELVLPTGVHEFALTREDGSWFLPPDFATVDDGFGGRNAILIVR
jgi:hypothetical protein